MKHVNRLRKRWGLTISLVLFVFVIMIAALILTGLIMMGLYHTGRSSISNSENPDKYLSNFYRFLLSMIIICTFLGTALTGFFSNKALNPIRKVIDAIHQVAAGNFNVQVDIKGLGELEELSQGFNKMTHELSSLETLRSDFINNFSHEFKTPIVSVRGFAKLLKEGDLSEVEKQEYLDIIIVESERLEELSTTVLNLSKYENIEIIADKTPFRLDEQIRRAIVMTEPRWSAKEIAVNVEMDEIIFSSNEDLTQQIWLNLLDNAIKFSHQGGEINVKLLIWNGSVRFTIQDNEAGMDEQTRSHGFDKFYQGDTSHAKAGNRLGLAIAKQIAELCGGTINVKSQLGKAVYLQ